MLLRKMLEELMNQYVESRAAHGFGKGILWNSREIEEWEERCEEARKPIPDMVRACEVRAKKILIRRPKSLGLIRKAYNDFHIPFPGVYNLLS